MAFQSVTNAGQVTIRGTMSSGKPLINTLGLLLTEPLTQVIADGVADVIAAATNEIKGGMALGVSINDVVVTDLRTEGALQFTSTHGGFPIAGTDAAGELPEQTAAVVSLRTNTRGGSFRGRVFLGGFCEDFSDGPNIAPDLIEAITDWSEHVVGSGAFGVISRNHDKAPRLAGIITPITFAKIPIHWKTQRRRSTRG